MKIFENPFLNLFQYLLFIIFSFSIQPVLTYSWHSSTELWDLEYTGSSFIAELNQWSCPRLVDPSIKYSVCDSNTYIMGGYNIMAGSGTTGSNAYYGNYWTRYYGTGIPTHNQVNVTYTVYPVDSWDGTTADDHYSTSVDGAMITCWHFSAFAGYAYQFCGGSFEDFPAVRAYLTFPHTATSMTLTFTNYLDQDSTDESLGIRDIQINFVNVATPVTSICGRSNGTPLPQWACPCSTTNQYMNPPNSGTCFLCNALCATCTGGTTTDCTSCYSGYYLSGGQCKQCSSNCSTCSGIAATCTSCNTGWFMVGTTCYPSCDPPLQQYAVGSVMYCKTPCPGQYVMWDGSCSTTCAYSTSYSTFTFSPATVNTFKECSYPCSSNQYLYFNGSCLSTCPAPLTDLLFHSRELCDYSCSSSNYLYWNGSCLSACPGPLSSETQGTYLPRQFCWYTCQPGQYLYWNGSCIDTCPAPLSGETQGTYLKRNFCWYTCQPNQFLYWNESCLSSCPSPLSAETQGTYLERNFCWYTCQPDQYLYWNGSCLNTCPSPLSGEVQGTILPRQFCWYTCQPDQHLYWDETCQGSCDFPLWPEIQGTNLERNFCWYPCQPTQYLYWNGTCSSTCPEPLTNTTHHGELFCEYPCLPTQYLYWNGSCINSCVSPLAPVTEGNPPRQFCYYLCPVDEFLYWDGSCQTSCDFPLVPNVEGSPERQFCWYLCNVNDYLYWNGTCSSRCDPSLVQSKLNDRNYCNYPCTSDQYLAWNGPCLNSCPKPLSVRIEGDPIKKNFCDYPCAKSEYLYEDGSCKASCPYPYESRIEAGYKYCDKNDAGFLKRAFLLAPTKAGATSLVCLVKIMHYIRYLDIDMPPRLEGLVQSQPRNVLTLQYGATMPTEIIDEFGEFSLIPAFQKPGNHSSFFVNYFQTFTSIAIALFAGFCLQFLEKLSMKQGYKTWQAIFEVLRVIFKWNFCLILLAFNIDFIILYSFLEFGTAGRSLGSGLPNFSLATNIFMILISIIFLIGLISLLRKVYRKTTRVTPEPSTNTIRDTEEYLIVTGRWQGFRILYTGFKETSKIARYFYLIYTIRIGLPILLACSLYHFPMISTTFQVYVNFVILVFILVVRPLKKKINLIQLILFETLAFMMNFCIFILTAINTYNYDAQSSRVSLGDAVIIGNSLTNLLSLVFLVLKLFLELRILIPLLPKMTKHEKYASFAKLFLIVVQQGAMGFESIFDELIPTSSTKNTRTDQSATIATETGLESSPRIKKRGAAFPTLSTEGDLQTQGDNTFDVYATSTRRLKDMTPGTNRIFNDNTSRLGLKDNISQLGGREASVVTEDTSYIGTHGEMSPTLRRGNQNFSSAAGDNSKGKSKIINLQNNAEPLFYQNNQSSPRRNRSNIRKEPYYNYDISGNNNGSPGGANQGISASSIHPYSASSAFSLDISDSSPQMRQPGFGNRRLDRTGTNLLASGTSKIYEEEERGASEVDEQLDRKAARWNYSYHTAVSQNLERDYNFPPEEDIHSKMQRKGTWQYWKAKGKEKKPEKSVFEYSDVTITKK